MPEIIPIPAFNDNCATAHHAAMTAHRVQADGGRNECPPGLSWLGGRVANIEFPHFAD